MTISRVAGHDRIYLLHPLGFKIAFDYLDQKKPVLRPVFLLWPPANLFVSD